MTLIPSSAITAAHLTVQRATNEQIRAQKVQSDKNSHHTEEVEELDDTAVNSVDDNRQGRRDSKEEDASGEQDEERVEIESLKAAPHKAAASKGLAASHLDISA